MTLKIIAIIFTFFVGLKVFSKFRDKTIGFGFLIFWAAIWSGALFLVFDPRFSDKIAQSVGIQKGTDATFFISIILLFYLVFKLYTKISNIERDLTQLNTNISKDFHKMNKKNRQTK